jgi:hypothetical protein
MFDTGLRIIMRMQKKREEKKKKTKKEEKIQLIVNKYKFETYTKIYRSM